MLGVMFSGRHALETRKCSDGSFFIDRDGWGIYLTTYGMKKKWFYAFQKLYEKLKFCLKQSIVN